MADERAAEELWRAIKGKGAFRHFKDTAARLGLLDRWHRHRDEAMRQFVIDWAEANGVPFEDRRRAQGETSGLTPVRRQTQSLRRGRRSWSQ